MKKVILAVAAATIFFGSYLALGYSNYTPLPFSMNPVCLYPGASEQQITPALLDDMNQTIHGITDVVMKIQQDLDARIYSAPTSYFTNVTTWYLTHKRDDGWRLNASMAVSYKNDTMINGFFWVKGLLGHALIILQGKTVNRYYDCDVLLISAQGPLTTFYRYYSDLKSLKNSNI